ncbi:MAG TPA: ABC transporter permease, partial [Gemmatimonadaceae bacterium]
MRHLREFFARVAGMFSGSRVDADLRAELEAHVEMETAENVRRGMNHEDARRQALLASGGVTQAVEAVHDQRSLPWLESIVADVKYAFRSLRHAKSFTAIVVITLALGIGANTAIFSVVRGVLLKPLPHRDGDRLVYLRESNDGPTGRNLSFSVPEVHDLRAGVPALGGIAEYSPWFGTIRLHDETARIDLGLVTGNYFEVMGLSAELGRLTSPADDGQAVPPVMVLTHEFWMKKFGGDPRVVGTQVDMGGTNATIIGVLQPAPFFPDRMDALMNMVISPHHLSARMVENRVHRMTEVVARLAPDATLEQARTQAAATFARMQSEHPDVYQAAAHPALAVIPFKEALGERARLTVWLLMGAAAFVLIISAANVTNLTLMRGVRREHELVVRAA